jgi:hypothetical protein
MPQATPSNEHDPGLTAVLQLKQLLFNAFGIKFQEINQVRYKIDASPYKKR